METIKTPRTIALARIIVLGVLILASIVATIAFIGGTRWYSIETPSMGQFAPRGSLVITEPVKAEDVKPGDFITFRSPETNLVFSHRVVEVTPVGIRTQGDVNKVQDAWLITDNELIGEVKWHKQYLGWILKGLPWFILGCAIVWLASLRMRPYRKSAFRVGGVALSASIVSFLLKPWVGLGKLNEIIVTKGNSSHSEVEVISTGLLPIKVGSKDIESIGPLVNGETGIVRFLPDAKTGELTISSSLALDFWWWVILIVVCLSPLIWTLIVGLPPKEINNKNEVVYE